MKKYKELDLFVFTFRKHTEFSNHCQIVWAKNAESAKQIMIAKYGENEDSWFFYDKHTWYEYEKLMERYGHRMPTNIEPTLFEKSLKGE